MIKESAIYCVSVRNTIPRADEEGSSIPLKIENTSEMTQAFSQLLA